MWPWRSPWHWGQWQGHCIFFLYRLICQFITPSILEGVSWNFQLSSLKNGTSRFGGITSSIYLNWNIFVLYCEIEIKLVLVKAEWWWLSFLKKIFFYVTSGLTDMTSLKFQLRISFLFYFWLSHNFVRVVWVVHMTLRSYQISCDLEGHLDIGVNGKVNVYSFFIV